MSDSKTSGGLGLSGALFVLFVALRLTDHIDWAWYWIVAPLWIPLLVALTCFAVLLPIIAGVEWLRDVLRARRQMKAWRDKNGVPKL